MQLRPIYILNDAALWTNLKAGDEKAFSILFERYYSDLVRYGNSLCPHYDRVQDCVQEVFTDIWIYRASLAETVTIKAYLLSSVRKRISRLYQRDAIFKKQISAENIEFLFDFSIEHRLIEDETTAQKVSQLNSLINNLPARQKEALYLRYHQQLSIEQIAEILGVNYQSASNVLFRGLQNLRKEWTENFLTILLITYTFS